LIDKLDPEQQDTRLAIATIGMMRILLAVVPTDHEALLPLLLKLLCIKRCAYPALRSLCNLDCAVADIRVADSLRDLIIKLAPPPSMKFSFMLDRSETMPTFASVAAETQKAGFTGFDEALLNVVMVDECGYPACTKGSARQYLISYQSMAALAPQVDGSWEHVAPLVLTLLRRLHQLPVLQTDEVLRTLCLLSGLGFSESRCLALEALTLLAPSGHACALKTACECCAAEDASLRMQARELLGLLARPQDISSLQAQLTGSCDIYTTLALKALK
jgi:hypothetical protein